MAALATQYVSGPPLSRSHAGKLKINGNDHVAIADLDDAETLTTADFTLVGDEQAAFFVITTTGDTTAGHVATVSLRHTASAAAGVSLGLIRSSQSSPVPVDSVALDMGTAADRNVILHVNPNALETTTGAKMSKILSLRFVGSGSLSNLVVRVTLVTSSLRHIK